jgi:hypothetical protein
MYCQIFLFSARGGHQAIVEILIEEGANMKMRNDHNLTPLDVAATPQIRKLLEGITVLCYHLTKRLQSRNKIMEMETRLQHDFN